MSFDMNDLVKRMAMVYAWLIAQKTFEYLLFCLVGFQKQDEDENDIKQDYVLGLEKK